MSGIINNNNRRRHAVKISKMLLSTVIILASAVLIISSLISHVWKSKDLQKDDVNDSGNAKHESELKGAPVNSGEITIELDNGSITVVGLIVDEESTDLTVHLRQLPGLMVFAGFEGALETNLLRDRLDDQLKQIYLRDETGREYRYQDGSYSIEHTYITDPVTGATWFSDVYLELPPLDSEAATVKLVIPLPDDPEVTVTIHLEQPK